MASVVVIDRDPIEPRIQIPLQLLHKVMGEAAQVVHLGGVFRRDDGAERVAVVAPALDEGAAVCPLGGRRLAPNLQRTVSAD